MILVDAFRKFRAIGWFLPGFILFAAFPPMCETTDVLFALAPLLWLSRQGDVRVAVRGWTQSGLFFWLATLSWMPAIVKNNGPWPLVFLGLVALAAYCTLFFAAFGYLSAHYWAWSRGRVGGRLVGILVIEPVLWCGLELLRSRLFGGFAWNQLGVVPANAGFGAPAALGGVYLLSAVVILINGTLAGIAERMIASLKRDAERLRAYGKWRTLETVVAFAAVWAIYQLASVFAPSEKPQDGETKFVRVGLVQRNFSCVFRANERESDPYEVYSNLLSRVALLKPDLVVLSESAMSEFGPLDQQGAQRFARFVREQTGGAALLAGGTHFGDGAIYNAAGLFQDEGLSIYDKVHLVPFGEYIPGDKWIPALQKLAPVGSCTPGEPKLLNLQPSTFNLPFGVAICFEDTDSALMRDFAAKGARFLCFITNDSWFSHSNEAVAHAWQATARAIETGLPVVRVGNSGVTGTIAPTGKASWLLGPDGKPLVDRAGTLFDRIAISAAPAAPTPYVRFGDAPLFCAFLLLIVAFFLVKYTSDYGKHRTLSLSFR